MTHKGENFDADVARGSAAVQPAGALFGTGPGIARVKLRKLGIRDEAGVASVAEPIKAFQQPETVPIEEQWERAAKDQERAQVVQQRMAEQASAKLEEFQAARGIGETPEVSFFKQQFRFLILAGIGTLVVVATGTFFAIRFMGSSVIAPAAAETSRIAVASDREKPVPSDGSKSGISRLTEFQEGIGRLSLAFSKFPGTDPEAIMRAVNKKSIASGANVCAFAWNDGQPALQFGDGHGGSMSISGTLARCAVAVEQFK